MPRPKPQTLYGYSTLKEARASVQRDINALLTVANMHITEDPDAKRLSPLAHRFLVFVSRTSVFGRDVCWWLPGWPEWAKHAAVNVWSNVQTDDYHLRRCRFCTLWMLDNDARRVICPRAECRAIYKHEKAAATRRSRAEQEAAWRRASSRR